MKAKARFLAILSMLALLAPISALDFESGLSLTGNSDAAASTSTANPIFVELSAGLRHEAEGFTLSWVLGFGTEGKYPAPFMGGYYGGFSADVLEAGISYRNGPFGFALGKLENRDAVDSPYSLFLSGLNHKAMQAEISFEDERLFFSDRWIGLNRNAAAASTLYVSTDSAIYDDRGAVLKSYGLKFGNFRFGFQDAVLFTGDYFDVDFFANPAPAFLAQYIATADGRPWSRSGNQNSLMGFFADYKGEGWTAYGQFLVDDFNMNRILNPSAYQNPDKIALSAGGTWDSPFGQLGFYAAGATKYTFASVGGEFYSWTYYPGSAVMSDGTLVAIPLADEHLGFVHGENSLATLVTWKDQVLGFNLGADLEATLSGPKSPANPWHEGEDWSALGTQWLSGDTLEKKAVLSLSGSRMLGPFEVLAQAKLGYVANQLSIVQLPEVTVDGNDEYVWVPSDDSGVIMTFTLAAKYVVGF